MPPKRATRASKAPASGPSVAPPASSPPPKKKRPIAKPTSAAVKAAKKVKTALSAIARRDHSPNVRAESPDAFMDDTSIVPPVEGDTATLRGPVDSSQATPILKRSNPSGVSSGKSTNPSQGSAANAVRRQLLASTPTHRSSAAAESSAARQPASSPALQLAAESVLAEEPIYTPERVLELMALLKEKDEQILRDRLKFGAVEAELKEVKQAQVVRSAVRRLRRAVPADLWIDAPTRDVLGLGTAGLHRVRDAVLIEGRNNLYKWVLATTHKVLWDGHSTIKDEYRIPLGASWGSVGPIKQDWLISRYRTRAHATEEIKPIFFFPPDRGALVQGNDGAESARRVFDDDWPIQRMLREAMKNERDGRKKVKEWRQLIKGSADKISATDRPLIGNSVIRIWRESRLSYSLSRTQTDVWDTVPLPSDTGPSAVTRRAASPPLGPSTADNDAEPEARTDDDEDVDDAEDDLGGRAHTEVEEDDLVIDEDEYQ